MALANSNISYSLSHVDVGGKLAIGFAVSAHGYLQYSESGFYFLMSIARSVRMLEAVGLPRHVE